MGNTQSANVSVSEALAEMDRRAKESCTNGPLIDALSQETVSDTFFQLLSSYRSMQLKLRELSLDCNKTVDKIHEQAKQSLWFFKKYVKKDQQQCSYCKSGVFFNVECSKAIFNMNHFKDVRNEVANYNKKCDVLSHRTKECSLMRTRIIAYISEFIQSSESLSCVSPEEPVIGVETAQQTPELAADVSRLREMLSVLFFFERGRPRGLRVGERGAGHDEALADFHRDVETWILALGGVLLRRAAWEDHLFLMRHLVCCRGSHEWGGASLIQFPAEWSGRAAAHFVEMVSVLGMPVAWGAPCEELRGSVAEWERLDKESDGDKGDESLQLSEADFMGIAEQLPIGPFCTYLAENGDTMGVAAELIGLLLRSLCGVLPAVKEYTNFLKIAIRMIIVLLTFAAKSPERFLCRGGAGEAGAQQHFDAGLLSVKNK